MDGMGSEKEQLQQIKKWIQENGPSLVLGLVLGLGGVYGWRGWQNYQLNQSEQVSARLAEAIDKIAQQQYEAGATLAQVVADENDSTMYAEMARLLIASARVQQGLLDAAARPLQAIVERKSSLFQHTAQLRLARIYLAQAKYEQATQLIPRQVPPAYAYQYEELRGDIAFYRGDHEQARAVYLQAMAMASPADDLQLLQMKLDDLPVVEE